MSATIASLYRHPVKGFTPEPIEHAELAAGACFPCDRLFAVEDGPSGFDPAAPGFVSKMKFTVLAKIAQVAKARTAYDEASGVLSASAEGMADFSGALSTATGRAAFEAWLGELLGGEAGGPLKLIEGPGAHRFMDHPLGHVSIINLSSVRDLEARVGRPIDPLRFRANLYVEGWDPWVENEWAGRRMTLGEAEAKVFKPIVRCAATAVDPVSAERDIDITAALFEQYGHLLCGIYVHIDQPGAVRVGDSIEVHA